MADGIRWSREREGLIFEVQISTRDSNHSIHCGGVVDGFPSKPSISTNTPYAMHDVASSRTWSDTVCGTGSGAMTPSDLFSGSGSYIVAGRSPQSAVSTNVSVQLLAGGGWLVSGRVFGVGLVTLSSSAGPTV